MALRVCVQHRERLFREGLGQLLQAEDDIEMVGAVRTGDDLMGLCDQRRPDAAVADLDSPDWNPGRVATRLKRRLPRLRVVGLYTSLSGADARLLRHGGIVAVSRRDGIGPVLDAVRGDRTRLPSAVRPIARASQPGSAAALTARELAVLTLVGGGHTSREISDHLQISHKTVENHKQRIFGKLGVQNQAHAVSVAMRTGMISPEQALEAAMAD